LYGFAFRCSYVSERELTVYHGGEVMNTFEVAVGEPDHPTPTGDFEIDRLIWNPAWVPPNAGWAEDKEEKAPNEEGNPMVGAKLFFQYPDYYIHGTDATHTLGQAESHGCIRMAPSAVEDLAEFVQTHGGKGKSEGWFDRVRDNDETKHEVTLPDPIPIDVHA
jgi:lipoprotein-anchoring transpeptidase ErfK/SrfK